MSIFSLLTLGSLFVILYIYFVHHLKKEGGSIFGLNYSELPYRNWRLLGTGFVATIIVFSFSFLLHYLFSPKFDVLEFTLWAIVISLLISKSDKSELSIKFKLESTKKEIDS